MRTLNFFSFLTLLGLSAAIPIPALGQEAVIPHLVVKDSSGAIVGPAQVTGSTLQVLIRDPANGDPFYLQFGKWWFRTSDEDEIYFSGANCTGNAYVFAPDLIYDSLLQSARGSVYVLGPDDTLGGTNPARIYRSRNGQVPADNSGAMSTKWRISNSDFGQAEGPTCTLGSSSFETVPADPVPALDALVSGLLANKPFKAE